MLFWVNGDAALITLIIMFWIIVMTVVEKLIIKVVKAD